MTATSTFQATLNGGPEQTVRIRSGVYMVAAVAAIALTDPEDLSWPVIVKIWVADLQPDYPPTYYRVGFETGALVCAVCVPIE